MAFTLRKYHIATLTTSLYATAIALFFMKSYASNGKSMLPIFLIFLVGILIFFLIAYYTRAPTDGIKFFWPKTGFVLINLGISILFSLMFVNVIKFTGMLYVIGFSFFIFIAEHIIFDRVER
jgi:hypothetical protein